MAKRVLAILFCVLLCQYSISAQSRSDSLYQVVENLPDSPSRLSGGKEKVDALLALAKSYQFTQIDSIGFYADQALALATRIEYSYGQGKAYNLKGIYASYRDDFQSQIEYYNEALRLFRIENHQSEIADLTLNLGMTFASKGESVKAMDHYFEALGVYESQKDTLKMSVTLNSIGVLYRRMPDLEQAEQYALRSIALLENTTHQTELAGNHINLGSIYKRQNNFQLALDAYQKALDYFRKEEVTKGMVIALNNIGNVHNSLRNYEPALNAYLEASQLNQKMGGSKSSEVSTLMGIAATYYNLRDFSSAVLYYEQALPLAQQSNKYKAVLVYEALENTHAQLGNYEQAYRWGHRRQILNDSLFNLKNQQEIESIRADFELEKAKQSAEIRSAREEATRWRWLSISLVLALVSFLALLFAFRQMRKRRESETKLDAQNRLNESQRQNYELEQNQLKRELDFAHQQLSTHALNMVQKNQILFDLKDRLLEISRTNGKVDPKSVQNVIRSIDFSFAQEEDWTTFQSYFDQVHHGFFELLTRKHPNLTSSDLRLCALIKLNLSSKEMATILGISPESVKMARYRLRKKLNLESSTNLTEAIMHINAG